MRITEEQRSGYQREHERLARLFREDRLGFERERKRLIRETIDSCADPATRLQLVRLQQQWDQVLNRAGSPHNRFVLMKTLFWDQVVNNWLPLLQPFQGVTQNRFDPPRPPVHLKRVK